MGNDPVVPNYSKEQYINSHPYQQGSYFVRQQNKNYIQNKFQLDENLYNEWRANVGKISGSQNSNFLYLPHDMGYVPNEDSCAKDGYAVVYV